MLADKVPATISDIGKSLLIELRARAIAPVEKILVNHRDPPGEALCTIKSRAVSRKVVNSQTGGRDRINNNNLIKYIHTIILRKRGRLMPR